jgi:hypothetical protein
MTCCRADPNPTFGSRNLFVIFVTSAVSPVPNTPSRPVQTDPSRAQIAASHAIPTLCEARADPLGSFRRLSRCKRVSMGERWSEVGGAFGTTSGGCFL